MFTIRWVQAGRGLYQFLSHVQENGPLDMKGLYCEPSRINPEGSSYRFRVQTTNTIMHREPDGNRVRLVVDDFLRGEIYLPLDGESVCFLGSNRAAQAVNRAISRTGMEHVDLAPIVVDVPRWMEMITPNKVGLRISEVHFAGVQGKGGVVMALRLSGAFSQAKMSELVSIYGAKNCCGIVWTAEEAPGFSRRFVANNAGVLKAQGSHPSEVVTCLAAPPTVHQPN